MYVADRNPDLPPSLHERCQGNAAQALPVPPSASLLGGLVFAQAFVADPRGSWMQQFASPAGVQIVVGLWPARRAGM